MVVNIALLNNMTDQTNPFEDELDQTCLEARLDLSLSEDQVAQLEGGYACILDNPKKTPAKGRITIFSYPVVSLKAQLEVCGIPKNKIPALVESGFFRPYSDGSVVVYLPSPKREINVPNLRYVFPQKPTMDQLETTMSLAPGAGINIPPQPKKTRIEIDSNGMAYAVALMGTK